MRPTRAACSFHGEDATDRGTPRDRHVGFVFQHYALFRHMTRVRERRVRPARAAARAAPAEAADPPQVHELLELVQLDWPGRPLSRTSSPAASGSASRWRARSPSSRKVLLLDEPFGALDAKVRKELRRWLRRLHDEMHVTSVFVTHDQEEALEVADRVVVMNQGRIEQVGTPRGGLRPSGDPVRATSSSAT